MNSRSTIILWALALALLAYVYIFELKPSSVRQQAQGAKSLPQFDARDVVRVEITRSNQTIRAELKGRQWHLLSPVFPAQSTAIAALLDSLSKLTPRGEISAQEIVSTGGLSPFGLDPPWAVIKIQGPTNTVQLRIGTRTLVGERVYVQPEGASGIFMTDAAFLEYLPETSDEWRNPMLVTQDGVAFDHIFIADEHPLKLERNPASGLWQLLEPGPMRADFDQVQKLIRQLGGARIKQFVSDDPKADLEPYGLQSPAAELTLALGTNAVYQIQFGKSPTNDATQVYARCLEHTNIVLVPRELADVVEQPYTYFRDHWLLSPRALHIVRIEGHANESFAVQRQTSNTWQITEPFQAPADPQIMQEFLDRLANLEVLRVAKDAVADFAPYGLVKPRLRLVLKTQTPLGSLLTNQSLAVDFGASATNDLGPEPDKVYCRRSDEASVYVLKLSDMFYLPSAAFLLRDRHLWNFASSNIAGITVQQHDQKVHLARSPGTGAWKADPLANAPVEEMLHRLGELQADAWCAKGKDAAGQYGTLLPKALELTLDVNENGSIHPYSISFGKLAPNGQQIFASVKLEQDQPVVFKFPVQLYADVINNLSIRPAETNAPP